MQIFPELTTWTSLHSGRNGLTDLFFKRKDSVYTAIHDPVLVRAFEADMKLNELLFAAFDAWEDKQGLTRKNSFSGGRVLLQTISADSTEVRF